MSPLADGIYFSSINIECNLFHTCLQIRFDAFYKIIHETDAVSMLYFYLCVVLMELIFKLWFDFALLLFWYLEKFWASPCIPLLIFRQFPSIRIDVGICTWKNLSWDFHSWKGLEKILNFWAMEQGVNIHLASPSLSHFTFLVLSMESQISRNSYSSGERLSLFPSFCLGDEG